MRALWVLFLAMGCRVEVGPPERPNLNTSAEEKPSGEVMIYTSMYRSVIDAVKPVLAEQLPGVTVKWLQGGSEKLGTRLDAELSVAAPQADIVMTSDPLWYERLWQNGHLKPYASIGALAMPRDLVHPKGAFATTRISTMVIAYNTRFVKPEEAPKTFASLFDPKWKGRVTTPDPLGSGTTFTTLAFLAYHEGPEIIDRMKAAQTISSGGNSSTMTRLESGEHHVGFVLLENVMKARLAGSPIGFEIPEEGAVLVPGPISILEKTQNLRAAQAVYDVLVSEAVQKKIVAGWMHSPLPKVAAPEGAPPLKELLKTRYRWTDSFVAKASREGHDLRKRFAEVMGGK